VAGSTKTRSRLTRDARREQLLDAAAKLLVERGASAVTMERLAEWAGVSKALPYAHFDNSDEVLIALHRRVVTDLGSRILQALASAERGTDLVPVVVRTYLDTVSDLGPILEAVTAPGSHSAELADRDRVGPRFVARLLVDHFDVPRARADAVAPVVLAALTGAVSAWSDRVAKRAEVEEMSIAVMRTLIGSAA
jgi:AcrR family transcriptional regulator